MLPHFSCKITILSSLSIEKEVPENFGFLRLPTPARKSFPCLSNSSGSHKERMNIISNFVCRSRPDLFYIDESAEVAAFVNLLGVPFVFARMEKDLKKDIQKDVGRQLAYALSLFNIASYDVSQEQDEYKRGPFYEKTKYFLKDGRELDRKLFCMYLEEEICLKKEEALKPLLLKTF